MSVITAILLGLAMGTAFGFFLEKARGFEPGVIIGQFQLRSFLMLRVFLAGLAAGLIALAFTYLEPDLAPWLRIAGQGRLTLDMVTGLPFWALALSFAATPILALIGLEKWCPWREEVGPDADGLMPPEGPGFPHGSLSAR
jgi:hypothetical protein